MSRLNMAGAVWLGAVVAAGSLARPASAFEAPMVAPAAFGVANLTPLLVAHAEGAQLYECKPDAGGSMIWTFREPIATLISKGKTVGRHYAGPAWELDEGDAIKAKLLASTPGASSSDIPLLKLNVIEHRGGGILNGAHLVLRLNTVGGNLTGPCTTAGELRAQPYSADYAFLP